MRPPVTGAGAFRAGASAVASLVAAAMLVLAPERAAAGDVGRAIDRALDELEACLGAGMDLVSYEERLLALESAHAETIDRIDDLCEVGDVSAAERLWRSIRPDDFLSREEAELFARCFIAIETQLLAEFPPQVARPALVAAQTVCETYM
jgi:hypothetical protein